MMQKWIVLAVAICLWIAPVLSRAAQPDQNFILSTSSEVFFPQAIRFNVTLSRALIDISTASLVIQPQGQAPITISIDLEDAAVVSDPYTELAYSWMIPPDNPPRLFEEITFSWRVVTTRDEVSESESSLTFTDQRTAWIQEADPAEKLIVTIPVRVPSLESVPITPTDMQVETTPEPVNAPNEPAVGDMTTISPAETGIESATPQLTFTPSGPQPTIDLPASGARRLMMDLQPVYESLAENTGRDLSLNLLVYTDAFPPGCTQNDENQPVARGPVSDIEIPCDESLADVIFRASGYELLKSESRSLNQIEIVVTAAMVARFYDIAWQGKAVPAWFQVGLKQFYAPNLKTSLYPTLMRAARNNGLLPLDGNGSINANVAIWQAQSYGLVLYIADQIGVPGLFRLANVDADTFSAAYQTAMRKPLSTLLNDWERWVFTDRAVTAFSFTAYQAATATPTATRTLSPTPTATATLTFTPTFTPTVTGVLSATPSPTVTSTRTLTPEPATSTPRPAGSLNTPTPVPIQVGNPISSLSSPATALGILTIGLVLIAVFALFLLRSRQK